MKWSWHLEDGVYVLRFPRFPGLAEGGFRGRALRAAPPPPDPPGAVRLGQVHGATVAVAGEAGSFADTDAVVSRAPGLLLTVRTADCVPILLAAPDQGVGLVHAGWRGLVAGVVEAAVARFPRPESLQAALGPAIGPCCFEVGPEVAARFPGASRPGRPRPFVDLWKAAAARLVAAGVPGAAVHGSGICTRCHQHLLYSHRGSGGRPGRILAFAAAVAPPPPDHAQEA